MGSLTGMAPAPQDPTDLPKRSWLKTLRRTFGEFKEDNLTDWAAALTYYAVLSVFPALIALVSMVGLIADPATITRVLTDTVSSLGPKSAVDTFKGPIESVTSSESRAGLGLILGLAGALWTASGYVGAFMRASNSIYEMEEGRPFWKLRPLQILVTLILELMLAVSAIAVVISGPLASEVGKIFGVEGTAITIFNIVKWPVILLVVITMLAILYYGAPNVRHPGFRWITPGGVLAVVLWIVASVGFAAYVSNFSSYNATYGSLAGVIVFLIWLWISNCAVLLGAEMNAELERGRELESGIPEEKTIAVEPRTPANDAPRRA